MGYLGVVQEVRLFAAETVSEGRKSQGIPGFSGIGAKATHWNSICGALRGGGIGEGAGEGDRAWAGRRG